MNHDSIQDNIKDLVFFNKDGICYNFEYTAPEDLDESERESFPCGLLTGSVMVPKVSKGLFETECLLVCQRYDRSGEGRDYIYGKSCPPSDGCVYEFSWDKAYVIEEIQMYAFDRTPCPPEDTSSLTYFNYDCPNIEFVDNVQIHNGVAAYPMTGNGDGTSTPNGEYTNGYDEIDLCFCDVSEDGYNTYRRDLLISVVDTESGERMVVGDLRVYCESIEEDERLVTMCTDLGYAINREDYRCFRDTDIKEQREDLSFMNTKRKEMLMEGHNIYPFIGSYISLINVLRFYGWTDVGVREWWRNVDVASADYGKYFIATSYSLTDKEVIRLDTRTTLPSKKFRKTNKMTLAYNINVVDDGRRMEKHGLPTLREVYKYTIEEVAIKLFGFKRKLEKEYLPLNVHIVDIVGEAFAFGYLVMRHNVSDCCTLDVRAGRSCSFTVPTGEECYIEDLRPFGRFNDGAEGPQRGDVTVGDMRNAIDEYNILDGSGDVVTDITASESALMEFNTGSEIACEDLDGNPVVPSHPISTYGDRGVFSVEDLYHGCPWVWYDYTLLRDNMRGNHYLGDFTDYYPMMTSNSQRANTFDVASGTCLADREGIPVGAVARLRCDDLSLSWGECAFNWDDASRAGFTFATIADKYRGHARVSWDIYKEETNTPEFILGIYGTFADGYGDIAVALPYVGKYSVRMRVWDWGNAVTESFVSDAIEVLPKTVQISSWYTTVPDMVDWNDEYTWNELDFDWQQPLKERVPVKWESMRNAEYDALDRGTFVGDFYDAEDPNMRTVIWSVEHSIEMRADWCGPYYWNNADVQWCKATDLTWDNTVLCGGLPSFFEFGWFDGDGNCALSENGYLLTNCVLEIVNSLGEYGSFDFTPNPSSVKDIEYYTRLLNESDDPLVSKFNYYYIYDKDMFEGYDEDVSGGYKILAVGKSYGKSCDMEHIGIIEREYRAAADEGDGVLHVNTDPENDMLRFSDRSRDYNPNWTNLVSTDGVCRVGRMTDVNFNYTDCRINGKRNALWEVWNVNDGESAEVVSHRGRVFHYVFKRPGCYKVRLTLEDTNGNVYSGERIMVIVD